jgi:predicted DNA-binding transcriptional regulator AlpA
MDIQEKALLRLPRVLALVGISRSHWWSGIAQGKFPRGVKISPRCTAWRAADIAALLDRIASGEVI